MKKEIKKEFQNVYEHLGDIELRLKKPKRKKMKKIIKSTLILILFAFIFGAYTFIYADMVYGKELFDTTLYFNVVANNSINITAEDGDFSYNISVANSSNTSKMMLLYRDTDCSKYMLGLNSSFTNLSSLYNSQITNISSSLDNLNYYNQYTACYFSLLGLNSTYITCDSERNACNSQNANCSTERDQWKASSESYQTQYTNCASTLSQCTKDRDSNASNQWLFGIGGFIAGFVLCNIINKKNKPTSESPVENTEQMSL